jgi:hypothetical protein
MLKEEIVIVEDEVMQAEKYIEHLKLDEMVPTVRYLKDLEGLKKLLKERDVVRIKTIRENDPDALIIVYTGYPDKGHHCLEAGADLFFEKDPVTYEDDLMQIRKSIIRAHKFREKRKEWKKITDMYSEIMDIDEEKNLVRLNCKLEMHSPETFERVFPLDHFPDKDKLELDQPILVQIFESPGEVRFIFKEGEKG